MRAHQVNKRAPAASATIVHFSAGPGVHAIPDIHRDGPNALNSSTAPAMTIRRYKISAVIAGRFTALSLHSAAAHQETIHVSQSRLTTASGFMGHTTIRAHPARSFT